MCDIVGLLATNSKRGGSVKGCVEYEVEGGAGLMLMGLVGNGKIRVKRWRSR